MTARATLLGSRIIVWDAAQAAELFCSGYYGKPIGIPKPRPGQIDAPLVLDLMEGLYLAEAGRMTVRSGGGGGRDGRRIGAGDLLEACRAEYDDFDRKYAVYKSFRDKGYVVSPGIKFGCDFAVYERGPGIDHAPYLVQVYRSRDAITSTGVVLAGRLAAAVRKQFILAIPRGSGRVDLLALDWWKA